MQCMVCVSLTYSQLDSGKETAKQISKTKSASTAQYLAACCENSKYQNGN